jgi:outer membrane receptor for ferrienterochelin and colicins
LSHRTVSPISALLSLLLLTPAHALADDVSGLEGLLAEPIVSSASKHSEGASSAPGLSTSVTAEELRTYGIRTLAEAMDFLAVAVSTSENLAGGEVGARGVLLTGDHGNHMLVLVDGMVVNDPLRGGVTLGAGAGIPLELVDHIEVIVGPGSLLYGSNAMFGLINVVTKRAKEYRGGRVIVESAVPTSIRAAAGAGATFTLLGKDGELTTQLEYYRQAGPDFFFDAQNTGVDRFTGQPGRHTRAGRRTGIWGGDEAERSLYAEGPSGLLRLSLGGTELQMRASHWRHAAPTGPGDFDEPDTAESDTQINVSLRQRITVSTVLELSARAYTNFLHTESHFIASRGVLCPFGQVTCDYTNTARAHATGLELQSTWDWFRDNGFVSILGADVRGRGMLTSSDTFDAETGESLFPAPPGLDQNDMIVAGYAQQTWSTLPWVKVSGGARVDSDPRFDPVVSPRVAASFTPWTDGTIKLSYATAFRAPSWDETDNATPRRIAATDLSPERVRSVEVGAEQRLGTHRWLLSGFYARWDDLVELASLSEREARDAIRNGDTAVPFTSGIQLTQYRNASEVTNYGMSTGMDGAIAAGRISYGVSLTGAIAAKETADGTRRLTVAPQLFGNARVAFVLGEDLPTVGLSTAVLGPRPADVADGRFDPEPFAPAQAQLRLSLTGDAPVITGLSYRATATYITADRGPYGVGPVTVPIATAPRPELIPVDRFRTTLGLQYAF